MDKIERRICDCCGKKTARLVNTAVFYGKEYPACPLMWHCRRCDAMVGCHPATFEPLGRLASKYTRRLRKKAHLVFDKLWLKGGVERDTAYMILSLRLQIPFDECHIGMMQDCDLLRVIDLEKEINAVVKEKLRVKKEVITNERRSNIERVENFNKYRAIKRQCKKRYRRKR